MRRLRARLAGRGEAGMTMIELLVAAGMAVVLVGAAGSMLVTSVRRQPELSERVQKVSTARYVLERMTREIRNGVAVYPGATSSQVSFKTQVRRTECGADVAEDPNDPAIQCRVTYACTTTACTRTETDLEVETGGTPRTIVTGLSSGEVFSYEPNAEEPGYIGVTLNFPNPEGSGNLTVSDGAGLRSRSLTS